MRENFPNLVREKVTQVQEVQRIPTNMNSKRPTPRHITIKMAKFKEKENLKGSKGELVTYKGALIRLSANF